ncbi:DNA polymerase domain-containing protein [Paenibacillus sp. Soil724D2]|uniref:DNA polymerase domain-containing protein n=1 Tax=Paenibacillus sp. (strain Soil724D2) TaxID=1736392 RepID=UPI000715ACC3|nr:DNA polymerase domain-containing protein [Paenibacillus sp. Soil724D2]KRE33454.1 DNA polymerase [Paenibacillus sp. Soil724D2]
MENQDLLFYDIECYPHNAFVVFKDIDKNFLAIFKDDDGFEGLRAFVGSRTVVGFNNYWYDDHMLNAMMKGWKAHQLKELNDLIIGGAKQYPQKGFNSLDCFQQIDVGFPSLKKISANMSKNIFETPIDFNHPTPLTDEEYEEVISYCSYDIDRTIDVYKMRVNSYFQPKASLVEMNGQGQRWNTTTLSANALLGNLTLQKWSQIRLNADDFSDLSMLDLVPSEVRDLWLNSKDDKGKVTITEFDNDIEFGFGGLHSVHKTEKRFENVVLLDVASMYPNIILNINALGKATEKYKAILEERIAIKHKDKVKSDALKLILNSVYGLLKNQYSPLFNPKAALSVCVFGQIALYELGKRLSKVAKIVQLNTDGVAFIPFGDYKGIWEQWEEDFNMKLEADTFKLLVQRDVNNYIGVSEDGKIKCKGGDTSRYAYDAFFKNNSARILDICLVNKVVYGHSVIDTLIENLDKPQLYMYVLQAGHTYKGTFDDTGKKYQKVNRIFPTRKGEVRLYKKREDDGLVSFPDSPEKMFVWNDDVSKLERFERIVDLNHYVQVVEKRLEKWM